MTDMKTNEIKIQKVSKRWQDYITPVVIGGMMITFLMVIGIIAVNDGEVIEQYQQDYDNLSTTYNNLTTEFNIVKDWCRTTIAGYENNITICPACAECNDTIGTYLTFEQYQKLSMDVKYWERRFKAVNNTDYIEELEDNLTRVINKFNVCNNTLEIIKNATQ